MSNAELSRHMEHLMANGLITNEDEYSDTWEMFDAAGDLEAGLTVDDLMILILEKFGSPRKFRDS